MKLITWLAVCLSAAPVASRAGDLVVLEDQFGAEFALDGAHERPFVIVYADRTGSKLIKPWYEFLDDYSDAIDIVAAANLGSAPRIAHPFIRKAFAKAPPTLLDWRGELEARHGFTPGVPNIFVFEPSGELVGIVSGRGTAPELAEARALVERL